MRFFLDENFPRSAAAALSSLGHEVIDIRGTELEGARDETIFGMAQEHEAIFLSTDRDFFHTVPHLYATHFGVIVIALRQPNRNAICDRLRWALEQKSFFPLDSTVIQLRDRSYLIRRKE